MTAWHEWRMVAFDVESTGIDVFEDRIVTAAIVHHAPGERPRTLTWVIDPGVPMPAEAAAVHGWTDERIAAYRDGRGVKAFDPTLGLHAIAGSVTLPIVSKVPLIGFNIAYDLSILHAECVRHGVTTVSDRLPARTELGGIIDPHVIDKHFSRRKGSRKLIDTCAHYGVVHTGAHDAGGDALATLRILQRQVHAYPELAAMPLAKLHRMQVGWRREQMDSLRNYFDRTGKPHDGCDGSWPLRTPDTSPAAPIEQETLL